MNTSLLVASMMRRKKTISILSIRRIGLLRSSKYWGHRKRLGLCTRSTLWTMRRECWVANSVVESLILVPRVPPLMLQITWWEGTHSISKCQISITVQIQLLMCKISQKVNDMSTKILLKVYKWYTEERLNLSRPKLTMSSDFKRRWD